MYSLWKTSHPVECLWRSPPENEIPSGYTLCEKISIGKLECLYPLCKNTSQVIDSQQVSKTSTPLIQESVGVKDGTIASYKCNNKCE